MFPTEDNLPHAPLDAISNVTVLPNDPVFEAREPSRAKRISVESVGSLPDDEKTQIIITYLGADADIARDRRMELLGLLGVIIFILLLTIISYIGNANKMALSASKTSSAATPVVVTSTGCPLFTSVVDSAGAKQVTGVATKVSIEGILQYDNAHDSWALHMGSLADQDIVTILMPDQPTENKWFPMDGLYVTISGIPAGSCQLLVPSSAPAPPAPLPPPPSDAKSTANIQATADTNSTTLQRR